jgi:CO/xanthine dehydrogenase FAD-binding subunit
MSAFELVEPSSLGEALGLLDPDDPAVRPIAGGTALMLMMKPLGTEGGGPLRGCQRRCNRR